MPGVPFRDALLGDARVAARLSREAVERLLDPRSDLGLVPALVDGVVGGTDGG